MNLYAVTLQLFSGKIIVDYAAASNGGAAGWEASMRYSRCLVVGVPRFCGCLVSND